MQKIVWLQTRIYFTENPFNLRNNSRFRAKSRATISRLKESRVLCTLKKKEKKTSNPNGSFARESRTFQQSRASSSFSFYGIFRRVFIEYTIEKRGAIGRIDIDFLILAWNVRGWPRKFNGLETPWIINIAKKRSLRRETSSCVELHSRFISQREKKESSSNVIFQLFRSRSIIDYIIAYSWHDLLPAV